MDEPTKEIRNAENDTSFLKLREDLEKDANNETSEQNDG